MVACLQLKDSSWRLIVPAFVSPQAWKFLFWESRSTRPHIQVPASVLFGIQTRDLERTHCKHNAMSEITSRGLGRKRCLEFRCLK